MLEAWRETIKEETDEDDGQYNSDSDKLSNENKCSLLTVNGRLQGSLRKVRGHSAKPKLDQVKEKLSTMQLDKNRNKKKQSSYTSLTIVKSPRKEKKDKTEKKKLPRQNSIGQISTSDPSTSRCNLS